MEPSAVGGDHTVLRGIVVRCLAECRTSGCRAWTVFGATLAASGAAVGEVTCATEEMHHKEVSPQHLAHAEDDKVLTVNCRWINCYSNPSTTRSTLVSVCHSLGDDVVDEFVAGDKSTFWQWHARSSMDSCSSTYTPRFLTTADGWSALLLNRRIMSAWLSLVSCCHVLTTKTPKNHQTQ